MKNEMIIRRVRQLQTLVGQLAVTLAEKPGADIGDIVFSEIDDIQYFLDMLKRETNRHKTPTGVTNR